MEKKDRVSTKSDRIRIKLPSGRVLQCTKVDLLQGVSQLPYIYNKSMNSDVSVCARNKREEQFNQLVYYICRKVGFLNPSNEERILINDTFREVWRGLRDAYRKNLRLGRTSYKYGPHMDFYRSCFQEEQAILNNRSSLTDILTTQRHKLNLDAAMISSCDEDDASSQSSSTQEQLHVASLYATKVNEITDHNYIALSSSDQQGLLSSPSSPQHNYPINQEQKIESESPIPYHIPTNINSNTEMMMTVIGFMHPLLSKLTTQQVLKLIDNITKFLDEHTS